MIRRTAAPVLLAAALGGCVTVLPKTKPVQLYRFGPPPGTPAPAKVIGLGGPARGLVLADLRLPSSAAGDGILTLAGDRAAYIAGARWLEPATELFQEDVRAAFAAGSRDLLLLDRSQTGAASAALHLDVVRFETRYAEGDLARAPTVVVRLRATLDQPGGRILLAREFHADQAATADRVSDIVAAYDAAVGQVLADLVRWADATASPAADAQRPAP